MAPNKIYFSNFETLTFKSIQQSNITTIEIFNINKVDNINDANKVNEVFVCNSKDFYNSCLYFNDTFICS